jgi:hypothetical protein
VATDTGSRLTGWVQIEDGCVSTGDTAFASPIEEVLDTIFQQDRAAFLRWINKQPLVLDLKSWRGLEGRA